MRDLLRTRKQFVRERSHIQRIQKTLEDANIKLDLVVTDVLGLSGRRILQALIAGQTGPQTPSRTRRSADSRHLGATGSGVARQGDGSSSLYAEAASESDRCPGRGHHAHR
jgi:hypothetical protein